MSQTRSILCALLAYFIWVLSDTGVKIGSQQELSPFFVMAVFGLMGLVILPLAAAKKRDFSMLRPRSWKPLLAIAACSVSISYVNVIALKHLPLTMFYVVVFTIPLVIAALSALLKHEVLTRQKVLCVIAGFFGAALAVGIEGNGGDWIGYTMAFASVGCFSISTLLMRKTAETDTVQSIMFLKSIAVSTVGIGGLLWQGGGVPEGWPLLIILGAGVLSFVGSFLFNTAVQHTASTNVVQFHYTQIVSGAIFGYFLWHEVPTWNLILGSGIIIASGMVVAAQARKKEALTLKEGAATIKAA